MRLCIRLRLDTLVLAWQLLTMGFKSLRRVNFRGKHWSRLGSLLWTAVSGSWGLRQREREDDTCRFGLGACLKLRRLARSPIAELTLLLVRVRVEIEW